MKKTNLILFSLMVIFSLFLHSEPTHIDGGPISGFWTAENSPYIIWGDCFVPMDNQLQITQNTVILFEGDFQIEVMGQLKVDNAIFEPSAVYNLQWSGIRFFPSASPSSHIVGSQFRNAAPAIVIDNKSLLIEANTFTFDLNVVEPFIGLHLIGNSSPFINNNTFMHYPYAIKIGNFVREESRPVIVNTRVRNSPDASRLNEVGIEVDGNVSLELVDSVVEDYPTGIKYTGEGASYLQTPVITNTRVRESGESNRNIIFATGILLENVINIHMDGDSISFYPNGIQINNTGLLRETALPVITNTRVRESSESARQTGIGISLNGNVAANIDDCDIFDFATGINYTGDGSIMRATPIITNTRVRESADSSRERALEYGISVNNITAIEIDDIEIIGYGTGIEISMPQDKNGRASAPVITNTRVRESPDTSRDVVNFGIVLSGDIENAIISDNELVDCSTGISITGTNNEIHHNVIYSTGLAKPNAMLSASSQNLQIYHNTTYNYNVSFSSTASTTNLYNNIFWHEAPFSPPIASDVAGSASINYNNLAMPGGNPTPDGTGNMNSNPMFLNVVNFNFRLSADSPCIDSADPNSPLSPDGSRADMGAYQYQETGSQSNQLEVPVNDTNYHEFPEMDIAIQFNGANNATNLYLTSFSSNPGIFGSLPGGINNICTTRYWRVVSQNGNVGEYSITFDLTGIDGIQNFETLTFLKRDGADSEWQDVEMLGATVSHNEPFITISGLLAFSEFVPAGGIDNPLPVTFGSFFAYLDSHSAILNWNTVSEVNLSHWNVLRAETEIENEISRLNGCPIWASGTSFSEQHYSFADDSIDENTERYFYWIEGVEYSGASNIHGPFEFILSHPDNPDVPEMPLIYGLHQNYPNPFNPTTSISFIVSEESNVDVEIFNVKGQKIRTLFHNQVEKDRIYQIEWNGETEKGDKVGSGIYFYQLKKNDKIESTRKCLLLK